MTTKLIGCLIFAAVVINACSKNNDTATTTIDVSKQWSIDNFGVVISSHGDGQWQAKTFNTQELNLFSSLDTANLSGTTTPSAVLEIPPGYNSTFPNPFMSTNILALNFASPFSGQIVFKCVVVDSTMTPHFKLATRLHVTGSSIAVGFNPTVPVGKFRFYYTLSSQLNPHFYKSWGNIQKTP